MKIVIVGAGETGKALANLLTQQKHDASIVEINEEIAKSVASDTEALMIKGDGTEIDVLKDAGIEEADAIVVATHDDKTNFLICQIARSTKVKKIIAKVNSPKNEELFTKLGIKTLVPVVGMSVQKIKQILTESGEHVVAEIGQGDVEVVELVIGKKSNLTGKPAKIPHAIIGTIYRDGELIMPTESTTLKEGDVLVLTLKATDLAKVRKKIEGE